MIQYKDTKRLAALINPKFPSLIKSVELMKLASKDIPFEKVDGRNAQHELGGTEAGEPVLLPYEWIQRVGTYILSKSSWYSFLQSLWEVTPPPLL